MMHTSLQSTLDSDTPSSTSGASASENQNLAKAGRDGASNEGARPSPASKDAALAQEWLCEYSDCGQSFTHRHKLNKHKKYHIKRHKCLESSCAARQVAFSLEKDLLRHQAKHNGRRFYCHHAECSNAFGGARGGFTRKDNLKRHIAVQHPRAQETE